MGVQRKKPKNVVKSRKEMRKEMRMEKKSKQKEFLQKRRENKFKKNKNSNSKDDSNDGFKKFDKKFPFKNGKNNQKKFEKPENGKKSSVKSNKKLKLPSKISPELLNFDPEASDFEDEEIDSDELSGNESETEKPAKNPVPAYEDKLAKAREKENNKLQRYEDGLKQRRIEQLQQANEEEDKIISKYEKLLKINKRKGKKDSLTNFNDGLDYILELCTKDSIEKMYNAAKEAAEVENDENDSDDEIEELTKKGKAKEKKKSLKNKKLEKIEEKYFGEDKEPETIALEDLIGDSDDSEFDENEENSDEEEEPARKKAKTDKKVSFKGVKEADSDGNSDFDILDSNESDEEEEENEEKSTKKRKNFVLAPKSSDDEVEEDDFDEEDAETGDFSDENDDDELAKLFANKKSKTPKVDKVREDIYGRKRDAKGNIIEEKSTETKYVPPHLRAKLLAESTSIDPKKQEQLDRLKKQLKGQINRLTEANVQRITIEIEKLYMQNARYDMNTTLSELICSALVSNVIAKERMVLEHMLVVAVLHANIGSEIGAFFLENLIQKFNNLLQDLKNLRVEDKTLDNYVFMLCHMYTFKLFQHNLIYSILDKLCEEFNEKSVECILLVLRSIGFQLRKDDPLALKDLILKIQKKANDASKDLQNDVRVKFMLDILLAIKNNNMTKIPNYDPSLTEHFGKLLKSLTHDGKHVATLNISMDDLLNVDKRGKWWLVGSAWAGNDLKGEKNARLVSSEGEFSAQLLELASKQRMNTDDRRKTFCIIMSAEDYMDAFEKLMHLSIKDPRVIITVIIHCCLAEKQFNPYYAVLTQKFCDTDRKYQLAVQYAVWDRIRELPSQTKESNKNLAKFISYVVQQGGQPLSVLKVIEFSELDKITHKFVKQIVMELLLVEKDEVFQNVFSKVALSKKLSSFKDSMKLFIHHFLLAQSNVKKLDEETQTLLKQRIAMVDQMFQSSDRFNTF
ncbi:nucleolar MIF4G domain-containing protein 1 homolog [Culicoides brevitarsis]|uniref:nucleolar MIF4G domain-containing protein 1 homolog n=1 Tax=Culicoides brevitarsis TaxID=469753 RepID=UPI00307C24DF